MPEILLLVLCATLSGMEDFVEIRLWGEQRLEFLRRFLPYARGLPAHDTLNDVVNALDAELFKQCFTTWVDTLRDTEPDIIAVDGKTSRRSHARGQGREPLHMVSAWASRQRLVLGQEATDAKSNEITAIPLLLAFGLDHNETRSWRSLQEAPRGEAVWSCSRRYGWHRHVSLVMLAYAVMAAVRHQANTLPTPKKHQGRHGTGPSHPLVHPGKPQPDKLTYCEMRNCSARERPTNAG